MQAAGTVARILCLATTPPVYAVPAAPWFAFRAAPYIGFFGMPVPTDTFWNIKRLNWAFLISGLFMLLTIVWSIVQDYGKSWRDVQINGRVWEAALTDQKIRATLKPEQAEKLDDLRNLSVMLDAQIKGGEIDAKRISADIDRVKQKHAQRNNLTGTETQLLDSIQTALSDPERQKQLSQVSTLNSQIDSLVSQIETRMFKFNNVKANVTVWENALQAARTAQDRDEIARLEGLLNGEEGRDWVAKESEAIAALNTNLVELKEKKGKATKEIDDLRKLATRLGEEVGLLRKKLSSLRAEGLIAKTSEKIRQAPLMGFVNPSEKVRQQVLPDVLTDVSFMKITTIDRCTTCHVHIERREFTEAGILSYLEEQLATARQFNLPAAQTPDAPTDEAPGALGLPEFWHAWAAKVAPSAVVKNAAAIQSITDLIGKDKQVTVTYRGKQVEPFTYDLKAADPAVREQQDAVVGELLQAWLKYKPADAKQKQETRSEGKRVTVVIGAGVDAAAADAAKQAAVSYPAAARQAVRERLNDKDWNELEERYRYALVDQVNIHRKDEGYEPLNASPALLAHPNLDLYVDVDSPHKMEEVGCTSCHDGSGQETDFVLAAHTARSVWVDNKTGVPVLPQQIILNGNGGNGHGGSHHEPDLSSMLEAVQDGNVSSLHFEHLAAGDGKGHGGAHPATKPATASAAGAHAELTAPKPTPGSAAVSYVDPLSGETRKAVPQINHWKSKYERESGTSFKDVNHYWDWPMRPRELIEANCARCHSDIHDIKEHAPTLYEGRTLFAKMGCVNCHQMDSISQHELVFTNGGGETVKRRVGPDLRHVNEKLSTAFLHSWIWAPKAFRPSTGMPHFFMLENNSSEEELRRTQQEVRAMTFYLQKTASAMETSPILADPANAMPQVKEDEAEVTARVERGRKLFIGLEGTRDPVAEMQGGVGCVGCHTNLNETGLTWITQDMIKGGGLAAELTETLNKTPTARELTAEARKRYEAMSYNERQLYAWEHFGERSATPELPAYADGTLKPVFQLHGPELSGIGTKLMAGRDKAAARKWLYEWLMDPRHYSAYTTMPRLRLTPDEALDLAEYLLAQERTSRKKDDDWQAVEIAPDNAKVRDLIAMFLKSQYSESVAKQKAADDAEMQKRASLALVNPHTDKKKAEEIAAQMPLEEKQLIFLGQKLITHYGCMSCHAINGVENAASPCANLSDWGQKAITKLDFAFLDHHHVEHLSSHEESAKSEIPLVNGISADAVKQVTEHLNGKKWNEPIAQEAAVAWPHVDHSRDSWLVQKLKNTRVYDRGKNLLEPKRRMKDGHPVLDENGNPIVEEQGKPYDKLRMPTFYFTDDQVHAIVTFVLSNRDKLITPRLLAKVNDEEAKRIAQGRQIVERYNCVGCHVIDANQPAVQQYWQLGWYGPEGKSEIVSKAPPSLRGEGSRVQHAWLFNFLKFVELEGTGPRGKIRPLPFIRMPSFPLTDDETTAIAAYFNAVSVKEAKELTKRVDPLLKETAKPAVPTDPPGDPEKVWPDDYWWKEPQWAGLAAHLKAWALENTPAKPIDFTGDDAALATAYKTALYDARFTKELFDAPYPFIEQPRPTISDERLKLGEKFFHFLQCHTCHVVSPNDQAPGVNQAPKGPNLTLAHRRLQRHWVRHWVQETQVIQVGSLMPPYFSGRAIPSLTDEGRLIHSLLGLPYVPSPASPEAVRAIQNEYGQTVEDQTNLLLDFMYAAGLRGYTSVDPPVGGEPKVPATLPADVKTVPIPGITAPLPKEEPRKDAPPQQQPEAAPVVASSGSVRGKVTLAGTAPKAAPIRLNDPQCAQRQPGGMLPDDTFAVGPDNGLRYVVVSVSKGLPPGRYPAPKEPAVLDQKGCHYEPHVLPMMVGQPVLVKNSDPFLHNVHGLPQINPSFNFGQNNIDPGKAVGPMKAKEQFRVKCDVHPWMNCFFVVYDHPFFAATNADGTYEIKGLPAGEYTLTTWHEKCPPVEQTVTVTADKPAEANFALKAE